MSRAEKIIVPGRNAWRSGAADKAGFLVDGAEYFAALEESLSQAVEQVFIVGWDFNPDIKLRPDDPQAPTLGEHLLALVERKPDLNIHILVWSMGPLYSGKSFKILKRRRWNAHPRIRFRLDTRHAVRGSHHQKLVVIDDALAFVGGIDLTAKRWDTADHRADDPLRITPKQEPYEPVHDLQMAMTGEAAEIAADAARRRWWQATGEDVIRPRCHSLPLPRQARHIFSDTEVAFSRTEPRIRNSEGFRESYRLTLDCLASARHRIYIESQYFASAEIAKILEGHLSRPDGPEIVVITTRTSHGWLERVVLGENRDRMIRKLKQADHYGRFRAFYPVVPAGSKGHQEVLIHAKLLMIDDCFIRIGSSNLNQRSIGLDTELDVALEASDERETFVLEGLRHRLLAEHLGQSATMIEKTFRQTGSLVRTIDQLNIGTRGLRPFPGTNAPGKTALHFATGLVDPRAPWWPLQSFRPLERLKTLQPPHLSDQPSGEKAR
ncbi:phospholipase D-like domain-containing protein [Rhizobium paknamense]|uniref:Phospholipase D n=1 Tax=Rhizobium paknamense TaxID=1206817 RepID=A0ABU0IBI3_9HYPH|nr:phospholipase D-like domain-containing protein [Rhizobium paknamense]MDQ0455561.1 phosphatidylserine/phosphatidylglycerophosphate/cardiolipin synthase-like enzyme [Rhizobium paknamense]